MGTRGALRIYLGAAPGVGKTYAALCEAHRRAERGTDVVVGLVEAHGRIRTEVLLEGLEVLPRRTVTYRGVTLTELDVDAVLARRPEVVVVDELAHTNPPGSRHSKRWQDVEDILDAGISVLSTVNIQHLESLGDVIERITGVRQQETVPDEVVRRAEQVELVDITPEALRRRLVHGNIYAPEKIDAALANYFQPRNLTALREMALLWVADQVEVALQRYRTDQQVTDIWETRERVVVALTGGPESETVLRRAARIAERSGSAELFVVHVLRADGVSGTPVGSLARLRRLTEDVGATFHTVVGDDVPAALLDFARGVDATQLVVGTSRRSRPGRILAESVASRVVQRSGHIDVHLVTHPEAGRTLLLPHRLATVSASRRAVGWALAVLAPLAAAGIVVAAGWAVDRVVTVLALVLLAVTIALVGGVAPAVLAVSACAVLGVFLGLPLDGRATARPGDAILIAVAAAVAVLVATVVGHAARHTRQAATDRAEAALLASFSREVLLGPDPLQRLLARLREAFTLQAVALVQRSGTHWRVCASVGAADGLDPHTADIDVAVEPDVHLIGSGHPVEAGDRRLLEAAAGSALLALRNRQAHADLTAARRLAEQIELRATMWETVGHDLEEPVATVQDVARRLRDGIPTSSAEEHHQDLATTLGAVARQLTALTRFAESQSVPIEPAVAAPDAVLADVAARAVARLDPAFVTSGAVELDIDEDLPRVRIDPWLLERVIADAVDAILRHGNGAPTALRAGACSGQVELRIVGAGRALAPARLRSLFELDDEIGDDTEVPAGLRLARVVTEALGASFLLEETSGGGLTAVIDLPTAIDTSARSASAVGSDVELPST